MIDVIRVLNYLCSEKHFNTRLPLKGSRNACRGEAHFCRAENKPHHVKHIKHIYLAKPRCRGAVETSEPAPNVLLCLHSAEGRSYRLRHWKQHTLLVQNSAHANTWCYVAWRGTDSCIAGHASSCSWHSYQMIPVQCLARNLICPESLSDRWLNAI